MEWIGQPNKSMPFSDIETGEPNGPMTQLCMLMWTGFGFKWGDYQYYIPLSYICEFMHW